jgi:hypothetical protein
VGLFALRFRVATKQRENDRRNLWWFILADPCASGR